MRLKLAPSRSAQSGRYGRGSRGGSPRENGAHRWTRESPERLSSQPPSQRPRCMRVVIPSVILPIETELPHVLLERGLKLFSALLGSGQRLSRCALVVVVEPELAERLSV